MKKRAISAVLAASMMLSVFPAPAFAAGNYTGGGMLPDEVTAQTLEQENADSDTLVITENPGYGKSFDQKNVIIKGGNVQGCEFSGSVTINNDQGDIYSCVFTGPVTIEKIKSSTDTVANTFCNNVTIESSNCQFRDALFAKDVTGQSATFTSCTFATKNLPSNSTFKYCVFGEKPDGVDNLSSIVIGDGLNEATFGVANSTLYRSPSKTVPSTKAYYQSEILIFGDVNQISHINGTAIPSSRIEVDGKYSITPNINSWSDNNYIQISNLGNNVNDITLIHQDKPSANLKLDSNGYPVESNGGTKDVEYANWSYEANKKELTLLKGEFDLTGMTTSCNLVVEKNATLKGLTYIGSSITNKGTISGGTYASATIDQKGTVTGGTFGAGVTFLNGTPNGGIFLVGFPDAAQIKLNDAANLTVNGLTLPADSDTIYIITNGTTEQSMTLKYTGAEDVYSWRASALGNDLGRFYAGYASITGEELAENAGLTGAYAVALKGIKSISTNKEDKSLTLTATSIPSQLSTTLEAVHKPTYRADDVTVKLGGQTISGDDSLKYSPDLKDITVADKSGDKTFTEDADYEVKITDFEDKPVDSFDGKPGTYKLAITFKDTADHTESLSRDIIAYAFTVEKGDRPAEDIGNIKNYLSSDLPADSIPYDGNAHAVTVAKKSDAPDDIEFDDAVYYCKDGTDSWTTTAPIEPGTYKVAVSAKPTAFYNACQIEVGEFTITKAKLTDEQKKNLYLQYDEDDRLASFDPDFDVSSFTGTDTYFYVDTNGKKYNKLSDAPAGEYTKYRIFTSTMYEDVAVDFVEHEYILLPAVGNFTYTAPTGLTTDNVAAKLAEMETGLTENSYIAAKDVTVTYYQVTTGEDGQETETPVAGVPTEEGDYIFKISVAASSENIGGADVGTPKYTPANDLTDPSWKFTISKAEEPAPIIPGDDADGAGTVVAAVIGTAAVGSAAYLVGTQVWLETNLPKGAAIPTNRQQLADLLWTAAGKPEPKSNVLFADIAATAADSQKAARWCVEQGLLKDTGESFKPGDYTFRPQVIKAWNDLQAQLKADK